MYLTSIISKFLMPAGVLISTKSSLFFPINPFPIGDLKYKSFFFKNRDDSNYCSLRKILCILIFLNNLL